MLEGVKRQIKRFPLLAFCAVIIGKIIPGFLEYCKIITQFGEDVSILRTAWRGTGDYYICGMYLQEYLQMNAINNYVFLVSDSGSEAKVTELFDIYQGHILKISSVVRLSRFSEFMQRERPLCESFEGSDQLAFIGGNLKGYHGLTLLDFYLHYGFGFQREPEARMPMFSQDIYRIREDMRKKGLVSGKTVLLSPYSTCTKMYLPPVSFWETIAINLRRSGYTVATNCFGDELPVKGTTALSIAYSDIVPFLNEAGGFIGIRNGLCDIISQSICHKIIIHTTKSDFWPDGRSKAFVGIHAMYDEMAVELIYSDNIKELEMEIASLVSSWTLEDIQ